MFADNKVRSRILILLWLTALLLVGTYLRVHGVNEYYYNPDELSNIAIAKGKDVSEVLAFAKFETHPPYPAVLRHFLMQLSDSPEMLRGESVFFGLLCILVYYGIGKNAGGRLTGCIAAFLITFSYGNILLSQVVRNYTMLAFFLGCAYWCYQRFSASQKPLYAIAYALFGLLSLMTHYSAIFMCFSVYAVSAIFMLRDKQFVALRLWTLANLVIAAYFGYQYFTEIQHNAYAEFFRIINAQLSTTAPYNTLLHHVLLVAYYIPSTASYFLISSSASLNTTLFFAGILVCTEIAHKRVFLESLFSLLLGAILVIATIYPYGYIEGGRHAIWLLPYIILPTSLIIRDAGQWCYSKIIYIPSLYSKIICLIIGIIVATLCMEDSAKTALNDDLEHPLTIIQEQQRREFLSRLTSRDVVIAAEMIVPYLSQGRPTYYQNLVNASQDQIYFSMPMEKTRLLYMPHPIMQGHLWRIHELLDMLDKAGELSDVQTVWIVQSKYGRMMFRDFVECMRKAGKAIILPSMDNTDEHKYIITPKFVGISRDVLLHHAYDCDDTDE